MSDKGTIRDIITKVVSENSHVGEYELVELVFEALHDAGIELTIESVGIDPGDGDVGTITMSVKFD